MDNHFSRPFGRVLLVAVLGLTILALPVTWPNQVPKSAIGPIPAWAAGSPDETLNPPPTPPKKSASLIIGQSALERSQGHAVSPYRSVLLRETMRLLWRVYWTSVRF